MAGQLKPTTCKHLTMLEVGGRRDTISLANIVNIFADKIVSRRPQAYSIFVGCLHVYVDRI